MNCKNCGKPLSPRDNFCENCGAPRPQEQVAPLHNLVSSTQSSLNKGSTWISKPANKLMLMFIGLCITHVLQIFLWFTNLVTASASLFGMSASESISMAAIFEESNMSAFTLIVIILYVVAAGLAVLPLFHGVATKHRRMIFSKIIFVLTILLLFLVWIACIGNMNRRIHIGLAFTGWLFILSTIGGFALTFIISHFSKQITMK